MEAAFKSRTLISLAIILIFGSCTTETTEDILVAENEQFSALINDKYFSPDNDVSGTYYGLVLKFNAHDSIDRVGEAERYWLQFEIKEPRIGINYINNKNNTSNATLWHWTGNSGGAKGATSGEVLLTEFDTISRNFSGTFHFEIERPENDIHYSITEGKFNNIEIRKTYCEPNYILKSPDSISLFNAWWVGGFTNEDETISAPPCDYYARLNFVPDTLSEQRIQITGGYVNSFGTSAKLVDSNRFYVGSFATTRIGVAIPWVSKFESSFFNFLRDDTITYQIANDQLILSNTESISKLVLTTIEGINDR